MLSVIIGDLQYVDQSSGWIIFYYLKHGGESTYNLCFLDLLNGSTPILIRQKA